jgi:transposase
MTPADGHDCGWKAEAEKLRAENALLKQALFGKKSEKMPRPTEALKKRGDIAKPTPEETQKKRAENQEWKDALPTEKVLHPLPEKRDACAQCGGLPDHRMPPEISYEYDKLKLQMMRMEHEREKARCMCGSHIMTAPAPVRVAEKMQYGAGICAWIIVEHCLNSMPFYRQAQSLARHGMPISDSQLGALFHRSADLLEALYKRLLVLIALEAVVQADETPIQVQELKKTRRAWMWVFLANRTLVYVFSASRSGKTPSAVLGSTTGTLVVDAYTGYNDVTKPDKRERAGCLAHSRRKFFEALKTAPEVQEVLDLILDVYLVEHVVKEHDAVRSPHHRELRQTFSKNAMDKLKKWLENHKTHWIPSELAAKAIAYTLDNWQELTVFLDNVLVPVDNNASESALRIVAKSRDSSLFVGNDDAGKRLAILLTLTKTAVAHGLEPEAYLADVLIRSQTPGVTVDELLPQNWKPAAERFSPSGSVA